MASRRLALILVLAVGVACQSGTPSSAPPSASPGSATTPAPSPSGAQAAYVVATFNGILTIDRQGRVIGRLVTLPAQSFPSGATLDPAGHQIVFSLVTGTVTGSVSSGGFGSDLYQVAVDGSGLRRLVAHEQENVFYSGPAFDPTGRFLYFQRRASFLRDGTPINEDGIERLELATGERKRILTDGTDPTISPDGRSLVYVHLLKGQVDTMFIADPDGGDPRPFFKVKDRFYYIQTPRFAPSGCEIVFSGAGRTLVNRTSAGAHSAHLGIPSEIYLTPCDGSSITSLGETFDDVTPAWSPDGTRVGFAIGGQVSQLTVATREVTTLPPSDAFTFGDLVWLK